MASLHSSTDDTGAWNHDVTSLLKMLDMTDHSFANILCILSASISNGHSLPPNTTAPPPYELDRALVELDKDIFNLRFMGKKEYCAFAAAQMLSAVIREDLAVLVK
jgi:hypothetical protein